MIAGIFGYAIAKSFQTASETTDVRRREREEADRIERKNREIDAWNAEQRAIRARKVRWDKANGAYAKCREDEALLDRIEHQARGLSAIFQTELVNSVRRSGKPVTYESLIGHATFDDFMQGRKEKLKTCGVGEVDATRLDALMEVFARAPTPVANSQIEAKIATSLEVQKLVDEIQWAIVANTCAIANLENKCAEAQKLAGLASN